MTGMSADRTQPNGRGRRVLAWIAVLAPPAAWGLQLTLGDAFAEVGCEAGGFSSMTTVLVAVTGVAAAIAFAAGILAWRVKGAPDDPPDRAVEERARFMALAGMLSSGTFLILILLGGLLPHAFLSSCGTAR